MTLFLLRRRTSDWIKRKVGALKTSSTYANKRPDRKTTNRERSFSHRTDVLHLIVPNMPRRLKSQKTDAINWGILINKGARRDKLPKKVGLPCGHGLYGGIQSVRKRADFSQ